MRLITWGVKGTPIGSGPAVRPFYKPTFVFVCWFAAFVKVVVVFFIMPHLKFYFPRSSFLSSDSARPLRADPSS